MSTVQLAFVVERRPSPIPNPCPRLPYYRQVKPHHGTPRLHFFTILPPTLLHKNPKEKESGSNCTCSIAIRWFELSCSCSAVLADPEAPLPAEETPEELEATEAPPDPERLLDEEDPPGAAPADPLALAPDLDPAEPPPRA